MSLSPIAILEAAAILAERRRLGLLGPRLPESCRPTDLESACAIQLALATELDQNIIGWKCGLPSAERYILAPLFELQQQSPCRVWSHAEAARVEPELALVLNRDLSARTQAYSPAEIDAAIGSTHLALELIGSRYQPQLALTFAENLADCLVNQGLYLGPKLSDSAATAQAELALTLSYGNQQQQLAGQHPAGHARAPLYWLVNHLSQRGLGLKAGQIVITGSYAGVLELPLNQRVQIEFADLGQIELEFTGRE